MEFALRAEELRRRRHHRRVPAARAAQRGRRGLQGDREAVQEAGRQDPHRHQGGVDQRRRRRRSPSPSARTASPRSSRPTRCCRPSASRPTSRATGWTRPACELTDRKAIGIDDYMRTNVPHIYAIGDVTGQAAAGPRRRGDGCGRGRDHRRRETLAARRLPDDAARDVLPAAGRQLRPDRGAGPRRGLRRRRSRSSRSPPTARRTASATRRGFVKLIADAQVRRTARRAPDRARRLRAAARADPGAEVGPDRQRAGPQRAHPPDPVRGAAGVLPRSRRPHDQLLIESDLGRRHRRIGGRPHPVAGRDLRWPLRRRDIAERWVLVVAAVSFVVGIAAGYLGWRVATEVAQGRGVGGVPVGAADVAGAAVAGRAGRDVPITANP